MNYSLHQELVDYTDLANLHKWCLAHEHLAKPGRWQGNNFKGGTQRLTIYEKESQSGEDYIVPDEMPVMLVKLRELGKDITGSQKLYNPVCVANIEFIRDGQFVPSHIDDNFGHTDCDHIRFNILIGKPLSGGMPIIEGEVLQLEAGDCWAFEANKFWHSCQEVKGEEPRVSASFGYLK